jgi:hypothetical protein
MCMCKRKIEVIKPLFFISLYNSSKLILVIHVFALRIDFKSFLFLNVKLYYYNVKLSLILKYLIYDCLLIHFSHIIFDFEPFSYSI